MWRRSKNQKIMNNWKKMGHIYGCNFYQTGFAADPFIDILDDERWRVYYTTRTKETKSLPYCLDVRAGNPKEIIKVYEDPLFLPGEIGTFDDSGITMTSILSVGEEKYLYYCGWNREVSVPYSLNIGLAIAKNGGNVFEKVSAGPIMSRSVHNPIGVSAPCVIMDGGVFKMWYITFTKWKDYDERTEPIFVIKYAESNNGIDWNTSDTICIDSTYEGESFARPWVIKDDRVYKMWFSPRGPVGFREKNGDHYMLAYAESLDGINWEKKPECLNLTTSKEGWDSEMIEYASVLKDKENYHMLYNGNQFGKTGFGYAISNNQKD
jgi:hypothetical protein